MGSKCGFQHPKEKISDKQTSDQGYHVRGHSKRMTRASSAQAAGSEEQGEDVDSSGGFMHPERVS